MAERFDYCRAELEGLRRLILHEPRGYPGLCAVFVLPPVNPGSAFGIIVLEQGGYTPMSGSNTMCAVTAMLESGRVPMVEPVTEVRIDTAVGTVTTMAAVSGGKVTSVTVVNVPAFVVGLDVPLEVQEFGSVAVDVVFGGQFFVQARAADLGLELDPARGRDLTRAAALIKLAAWEQLSVRHPVNPSIDRVNLVTLHSGDRTPGRVDQNATDADQRRAVDRRPAHLDRGVGPLALRHRHLLADGRPARPRPTGDRGAVPASQHHRQRVRRRADRHDHRRPVRRRAAPRHRPRLGHRPHPLGPRRHRPVLRPATPSATSGPHSPPDQR